MRHLLTIVLIFGMFSFVSAAPAPVPKPSNGKILEGKWKVNFNEEIQYWVFEDKKYGVDGYGLIYVYKEKEAKGISFMWGYWKKFTNNGKVTIRMYGLRKTVVSGNEIGERTFNLLYEFRSKEAYYFRKEPFLIIPFKSIPFKIIDKVYP